MPCYQEKAPNFVHLERLRLFLVRKKVVIRFFDLLKNLRKAATTGAKEAKRHFCFAKKIEKVFLSQNSKIET